MRDIVVTLLIFGTIPFIWKEAWIGVLVWLWVSVMNPHRFSYGFSYDFPFAALIAVVTLLSMLKSMNEVRLPNSAITRLLILFPIWMCVTTVFGLEQDFAYTRWKYVMKIFFFVVIAAALLKTRKHIEWMIWVLVISVGFFGIKGGIFTVLTGGSFRVAGPPGAGFMSDNNAISVALVMTVPLMFYLRSIVVSKWLKLGFLAAVGLSAMAILGSQSRGAFLAISMMTLFVWIKSQKKLVSGLLLVLVIPLAIGFMPDSWTSRMKTIETYQQDTSAMGRINSWTMAFNLANDRPLVGGGFEISTGRVFAKYAPDPTIVLTAHSIYFQILGEHGYVGLLLFLSIGMAAWTCARRIIKLSGSNPDLAWAANLARAVQISLIGYAVGGAFINIAYWELPYYEIVGLMAVELLIRKPQSVLTKQDAGGQPPSGQA
jgi:probable O-glycosylation ligase (exosortase A-associated)